ncbi:MAG: hypothetical protein JEY94_02420 [Melioribacteraceae bacterium]|nr:hypothetical protein [Melioribacteraceae bacterium]
MKKKPLFKNYSFEFSSSEKKILKTFCKQAINQMSSDERYFADVRAFTSIENKLNSDEYEIKLTKDEKVRITHQIKANVDNLQKMITKSWFIKKWIYRSMMKQYSEILVNHFSD